MSAELRAALNPRGDAGAQWNCIRITGPATVMQNSYECTLSDSGPGVLGLSNRACESHVCPSTRWSRLRCIQRKNNACSFEKEENMCEVDQDKVTDRP